MEPWWAPHVMLVLAEEWSLNGDRQISAIQFCFVFLHTLDIWYLLECIIQVLTYYSEVWDFMSTGWFPGNDAQWIGCSFFLTYYMILETIYYMPMKPMKWPFFLHCIASHLSNKGGMVIQRVMMLPHMFHMYINECVCACIVSWNGLAMDTQYSHYIPSVPRISPGSTATLTKIKWLLKAIELIFASHMLEKTTKSS